MLRDLRRVAREEGGGGGGSRGPLPLGWYRAVIVKVEMKQTRSGDPRLWLETKIVCPEHLQGRQVNFGVNLGGKWELLLLKALYPKHDFENQPFELQSYTEFVGQHIGIEVQKHDKTDKGVLYANVAPWNLHPVSDDRVPNFGGLHGHVTFEDPMLAAPPPISSAEQAIDDAFPGVPEEVPPDPGGDADAPWDMAPPPEPEDNSPDEDDA
jgi:hypothetical protein